MPYIKIYQNNYQELKTKTKSVLKYNIAFDNFEKAMQLFMRVNC